MKKLIPIIAVIMLACFSIGAWQPSFAGTWRDDFEDNDTREWKIFNIDRKVEKWWVSDGEAIGEIFLPGFMSPLDNRGTLMETLLRLLPRKVGGRQR